MTATSPALETPKDGVRTESTQIRRTPCLELSIDSMEFHLFRPRTSRHPLLRAAYDLWRNEWQATLGELDGVRRLHSDEFARLDEIGVLSVEQHCIALTGLRWLDLSLPMAREDSYFEHWPDDAMQAIGQGTVCISSNTVVRSQWRRAIIDPTPERAGPPAPLALTTVALGFRRFLNSAAERLIAVTRNDRSMNRVASSLGAEKIGQIRLHTIDSDLVIVRRERAKTRGPVLDVLWTRRYQEQT